MGLADKPTTNATYGSGRSVIFVCEIDFQGGGAAASQISEVDTTLQQITSRRDTGVGNTHILSLRVCEAEENDTTHG
jgi:hypothetical protein